MPLPIEKGPSSLVCFANSSELKLCDWIKGKTVSEIYQSQMEYLCKTYHTHSKQDRAVIAQLLSQDLENGRAENEPPAPSENLLDLLNQGVITASGLDFLTLDSSSQEAGPLTFTTQFNTEESSFGVRGLYNSGNDCFLNALFQVILLGDSYVQRVLSERFPLIENLIEAYKENIPLSTRMLRDLLMEIDPRGTWLEGQHDPQEALAQLLGSFQHVLCNQFVQRAAAQRVEKEPYVGEGIPLSFPLAPPESGKISFEDLLMIYFEGDPLDSLRGQVLFDQPLENLVFFIKAFDSRGNKIHTPVEVPEMLDLAPHYFGLKQEAKIAYELTDFIEHVGQTPHSGHYIAYVSRRDGQGNKRYFRCNDSVVEEIQQGQFLEKAKISYMHSFRRVYTNYSHLNSD
ncbi:MAG: ubiquitin carboxyl-terminal hydrolase [Chlamydiales bacterium]|nr:ubiquitin carboxyl-terminal hydrolase [Chlamydiales bacterium]